MGKNAVTSPSKRKGDRAELEVQAMLRDHLGVPARRALGAGRKDDMGDIHGVPGTVIQVASRRKDESIADAVRNKPLECERQRRNKTQMVDGVDWYRPSGVPFAATFLRLNGGEFRVVMTPEQFFALWREAQ